MSTCENTGKVVYASPQAAYRTAQILGSAERIGRGKREKQRARDLLKPYMCKYCKGWHIGHQWRERVA